MYVTTPVVRNSEKKKESGQLERWYFHLGTSDGISVFLDTYKKNG